jgi:hypothetical protein
MTMVPMIDWWGIRTCSKRIGAVFLGYDTLELIVTADMLVPNFTMAVHHTIAACVCKRFGLFAHAVPM